MTYNLLYKRSLKCFLFCSLAMLCLKRLPFLSLFCKDWFLEGFHKRAGLAIWLSLTGVNLCETTKCTFLFAIDLLGFQTDLLHRFHLCSFSYEQHLKSVHGQCTKSTDESHPSIEIMAFVIVFLVYFECSLV